MRRCTGIVALVLILGSLVGCGRGTPVGAEGDDSARLHQQALDALDRWDRAVQAAGGLSGFIPVGELTAQVGDWELETGGNNKLALLSGLIDPSAVDINLTMPAATVTWPDGAPSTVRTVSVQEAITRMRAAGSPCADCATVRHLLIDAARPITVPIETTRGRAMAPAWEFTLAGTAVKLTHIAVAMSEGVRVTPPSWDPVNSPRGIWIEKASVGPDDRRLTVTFTGSPGPASQPCGADYAGSAVESATGVVVIVTETRYVDPHPNGLTGCTAIGMTREATVELSAPLADRAVLEVVQGLPVPVTRTK
jgi:hypothetical protein